VGGSPAGQKRSVDGATRAARDYLDQIQHVDLGRIMGYRRNLAKIVQLVKRSRPPKFLRSRRQPRLRRTGTVLVGRETGHPLNA